MNYYRVTSIRKLQSKRGRQGRARGKPYYSLTIDTHIEDPNADLIAIEWHFENPNAHHRAHWHDQEWNITNHVNRYALQLAARFHNPYEHITIEPTEPK
jgi:hypothetical protein